MIGLDVAAVPHEAIGVVRFGVDDVGAGFDGLGDEDLSVDASVLRGCEHGLRDGGVDAFLFALCEDVAGGAGGEGEDGGSGAGEEAGVGAGLGGGVDEGVEMRVDDLGSVGLVEAVLGAELEVVEALHVEGVDEPGHAGHVEDRVLAGYGLRQDGAGVGGFADGFRDKDDDLHSSGQGHSLGAPARAVVDAELDAAIDRRGDVVGVALDLGG
mmetsp:Transcript_32876/g.104892  ORF Transcript_32876/g.104892 Transcript_32876/m.104892 type:complete len:212 (+) Transcript_32876:185-820(+)